MKRIVTVQDISCVGKCSLTVALPIISSMGVETAVIPTAVLSTHTMFKDFTFRDLTEDIVPIYNHWKKENITFDAVYTGYLGSKEQLNIVSDMFDTFKTNDNLIVVDPVMADNGKLYPGFTEEFAKDMAKLCGKADIILPNLTEATFMLGVEYVGNKYDREYIKNMLVKLTNLGCKKSAITGVSFEEGKIGIMGYDSETKEYFEYYNELQPVSFHGTGDIFASAVVGALMNDFDLLHSLKIGADYVVSCIKNTMNDKKARWYGVNFEQSIPELVEMIKK